MQTDLYKLVTNDKARYSDAGETYAVGTLDYLLGGGIYIPVAPGGIEIVDLEPATPAELAEYEAGIEAELAAQRAHSWAM
jgi:hypothetical protein